MKSIFETKSPILQSLLLSCFILVSNLHSAGQDVFVNRIYNENIRTAQVYPTGNKMGYPLLELGSTAGLEFHFDEIAGDFESYNFGVIHCDHNWKKSDLEYTQYLQGFPFIRIEEMSNSFNTLENYVHYQFKFPNDMMKPRYSGNYLVVVFEGNDIEDRDKWLLTYRILIFENHVAIRSKVQPSSIISQRFKSQDVTFSIAHPFFQINDPQRDLSATLMQNFNWKTAKTNLKPLFIKPGELSFEYTNGENTFGGGNEYRSFEMKSLRYASNEVENIVREDDGYHVYLRTDLPQAGKAQSSGIDINGNLLIRNDEASNSDLEAEYVWVHFKLKMAEIPETEIQLEGRFTDFDPTPVKCVYDEAEKAYVCEKLVKQGYYNYRFTAHDIYMAEESVQYTEGNQSTTENDYHIIVYLYDRTIDCERIIGLNLANSVRSK